MIRETIIWIIASSVLAMVLLGGGMIWATVIMRPKVAMKKRIDQIGRIGKSDNAPQEKSEGRRQKRIQEKLKQISDKNKKRSFIEGIEDSLLQAGLDVPPSYYLIGCVIFGLLSAAVYIILGFAPIGAIPAGIIAALLVPKFVLKTMASRRQKKFTSSFADAVDLIVRGIRSGLPVMECFNVIAREFPPPVGEEFRLLVEGQNLGINMDTLLEKGIQRIPTSEYKFFGIVTEIQRQTGGNLADTLANLSNVLRERKKMRDKARAMASEAKSSAAIIGSLPFLVSGVLSVAAPDYLMLLFTETTGNYMLMGGGLWMFMGTMVMRKMINFKM